MTSSLHLPSADVQQNFTEVTSLTATQGKDITLRLLKKVDFIPEHNQITSVSVVPFIANGKMVAVNLQRGLDIPGGHIEASDDSIIDAVQREAQEEACIQLAKPMTIIGIIESNYDPKLTTYMLILVGRVARTDAFEANFESTSREIVTTHEFMQRYTAGSHEMMNEIIKRAKSLYGPLSE